jgi:hypothetical protein
MQRAALTGAFAAIDFHAIVIARPCNRRALDLNAGGRTVGR